MKFVCSSHFERLPLGRPSEWQTKAIVFDEYFPKKRRLQPTAALECAFTYRGLPSAGELSSKAYFSFVGGSDGTSYGRCPLAYLPH